MSCALLFLAEGFEEIEALSPVDILRRAGVDTKMVSVSGSLQVTGRSGITVSADLLFEDADPCSADILILPGGMPGTTNLRAHEGLCAALVKAAEEGKLIAAICAAPTVFGALGLLEGRKVCCYPGLEGQLTGAEADCGAEVLQDGNIITSRGAGTAVPFALKIVEVLLGQSVSCEIKKSIVYRD